MNDKIFTFLLIVSVLWVGLHFFTDLSRYTKENKIIDTSKIDNMFWTFRTLMPRFNTPNTRIIFN